MRTDQEIIKEYGCASHTIVNSNWTEARYYMRRHGPDFDLFILKKCPGTIKFIDKPTIEECLVAVETNGFALEHIKKPNRKICEAAGKNCIIALKYVPAKFQTEELCKPLIEKNPDLYQYIKCKKTKRWLAWEAIRNRPENIKHAPEQDEHLCWTAIFNKQNSSWLEGTMNLLKDIKDHTLDCYIELIKSGPARYLRLLKDGKVAAPKENVIAARLIAGI